ncbi:NERD domain-containing protein [Arthrobacter sp. AETb3-4]|uniref:NERD domain-containing protein n=1 Tax=Arthrobacter wenxiniae TaxID=2713570 RepID=A0A7Y7IJ94_9MICC|nr:NERD domain-containing protein [Arthrobacter wenxiniae]
MGGEAADVTGDISDRDDVGGPGAPDLRARFPGQAVVAELLRRQGQIPPRRLLARLFGASPLTPDTSAWFKGALGEFEVGRLLAGLGPGCTVVHAVPVGAGTSDIDHVIIGPQGVFTVNTKNHSGQKVWVAGGTFMVNGKRLPHIRNSLFEANRAARILGRAVGHPVAVTPMVVVVSPLRLNIKRKPDGVEVVDARGLPRWFYRQPQRLAAQEAAQIAAAACRPLTWHRDPPGDGDPALLMARFETLRRDVASSLRRRMVWGAAMVAGLFVAIPAIYQVYLDLLVR